MSALTIVQQLMPGTAKPVSLEELFSIAQVLGKLSTGGIWGPHATEIQVNFASDDYVCVRSRKYQTLKENLADCIARAQALKEFYRRLP